MRMQGLAARLQLVEDDGERIDHRGVELRAGVLPQLVEGHLGLTGFAVAPLAT